MIDKIMETPLFKWVDKRMGVGDMIRSQATEYPAPNNLSYMWNFGSLAIFVLIIQVVTGIFLAMYYKPDAAIAFDSVERIMREVNYGWLLRYMHAIGASAFFVVIYMHIGRNMYYGSYKAPRELLWIVGVVILLIMQGTAFFGYLLPWGQMSFWWAAVITNLFGALPYIGDFLVELLRGGFGVDDPTLNRFFSLHYLFPFLLFAVVGVHMQALHMVHSNNPDGVEFKELEKTGRTVPLHPYYTIKDLFGLGVFLIGYCYFIFYNPTGWGYFMEVDNFVPANPMQTPAEIKPLWYLTPWYAILRSFPWKLIGVIAMGASLAVLFLLPWLDRAKERSGRRRPVFRIALALWFVAVVLLGYCGLNPPTETLTMLGRLCTAYYFGFFIALPWISKSDDKPATSA